MSDLALLGGDPVVVTPREDLFDWPILGPEEEAAVLATMRKPSYLDFETVPAFESELKDWLGTEYVITESSGTHAVLGAMFACGVGPGDEVIVPGSTYWASCVQAFTLRAKVVFADIDPLTMNLDPADVERKITDRTKAIVVVHLLGYPVDMDAINAVARPRGIKVIEDASHAHGSLYRNRRVGTLGDIAAFSMCGKPLAIGEGGMIATDDPDLHDRALAWGHNFRFHPGEVQSPDLLRYAGLPLGGVTSRMHNLSAAIGRVQLRHFDERIKEIDKAMNHFWDLLADIPGLVAHRPPKDSGSTMGGWYNPHGVYLQEHFGGLSVARFVEAIRAEGYHSWTRICIREPLHTHELFRSADVYGEGVPTNSRRGGAPPQGRGDLPVAESVRALTVPPFRRFDQDAIEMYAAAFRKVADNYKELLPGDRGDESVILDERGNG